MCSVMISFVRCNKYLANELLHLLLQILVPALEVFGEGRGCVELLLQPPTLVLQVLQEKVKLKKVKKFLILKLIAL